MVGYYRESMRTSFLIKKEKALVINALQKTNLNFVHHTIQSKKRIM